MDKNLAHRDCQYYAPVDAAKGICHQTKQQVSADAAACAQCAQAPKCSNCKHYAPGADDSFTGVCRADKAGFFAYADMSAGQCKTYAR